MRSKFKWIFTLLVAFTMQFSFAQEKTVTGNVSDELGTLAGATVVVQGSNRGVTTDFDGNYSISAKQGEVLEFSFAGKRKSTVTVGAANVYDVVLQEGFVGDEIVLTGIVGVARKADAVTSTYQVVKAEELNQAANPNAVQALAGKVSGLQISTTSNGVNQTNSIVLRGNRSITGSNEALIVIDNAISSATVLQNLAPESIESMNVIKGAQGAALYGDRGVNGVIVVTTKRGNGEEKVSISLNSSIAFENISFMPTRQERFGQGWSGQHVTYENGAWGAEFDGVSRTVGQVQADGTYIMAPYSPIDKNINEFFKTGTLFQNGISISGGSLEKGYVSITANKQNTDFVVDGDKLDRASFIVRGGKKIGKWTLDGNVNYITSKTEQTTPDILQELLQAATNIPVEKFRNSGNEGAWTSYYRNPYWRADNERQIDRSDYMTGSATLGYEVNKNIKLNYIANVRTFQNNGYSYINEYIDNIQLGGGDASTVSSFSQYNSGQRDFYGDLTANFNYKLTDKIGFNGTVGNNVTDRFFKRTTVGGTNLTIPGLYTIDNVENVAATTGTSNYETRARSASFFTNLDFDYNDYLYLTLTGRYDMISELVGSSQGNKYFYPSVGMSFIPTKAFEGLRSDKGLKYAKVYANYIRVGNRSTIGAYDLNNLYTGGAGFPYGNNNSFVQDITVTDGAIKPEFQTTLEGGINLGFLKDRLTLDFSAYKTTTTDLITSVDASAASGLSRLETNIGKMTNKGFEVDLGFTPIAKSSFNNLGLVWENRLSYTTYKAIVDEVSDQADEVALVTGAEASIFAVKGEEFPVIKGTAYERDDQGRVIIGSNGNPLRAEGLKVLGKSTPDYILNYSTSVSFKGVKLSMVMDYRTGHQFYAQSKDWLSWSGHLYESAVNGRSGFIFPNSSIETTPGVYTANTSTVTGGNTYSSYLSYFQDEYADIAENMVLDATALKIREIALSYGLPSETVKRIGLSSLRFSVSARNPFVFLAKENRGYADPESSFSNGNGKGFANIGRYPTTRTMAFTLNATF
ncbi:SusC/RagA family TonB-linked outer membrane protein [uncultured Flavobacterium sp.]|uniref:SusC/RagA family TonB-linked outer membrane protein n=1 Tax=uncultured Flavobacterium sp. TaxID=165435 RepID=UPI0030ECD0B9